MTRIGVDLGGTKIEAIALGADGCELARRRIASPSASYEALLGAVAGLVGEIRGELAPGAPASVGVGTPGARSPTTGLIQNANSTVLNGRRFDADLAEALGHEVRVANDADCFALSEATDGAGAGQRVVFGVILGTGTGGGIVWDGAVHRGRNGIAGEWGHCEMPARPGDDLPETTCWCGRRRCIETYLSGPALAADHARAVGVAGLDARAVVAAARQGDAAARATLARHADRLAAALAMVIGVLDPDVVVLGGGLSTIDELYPAVAERLPRHVTADLCTTPVLRNRHGDASGVRGAAWLWPA